MLCEKCGKNHANTYYKTTVNGKTKEMYLCSECAAKLNGQSFDDIWNLGGLFFDDSFFGKALGLSSPKTVKHCPSCGVTVQYIADTGKVGCADCYTTFDKELEAAIKRAHGASEHKNETQPKADPIAEKKALLRQAIENEEYEKAAEIRDEIRKLEAEK